MPGSDEIDDFEKRLTSQLYRFDCPTSSDLGDFHFNLLPDNLKEEIESHLKTCPWCREELEDLKEFVEGDITNTKSNLQTSEVLKKIIPFPRNDVQYIAPELKTAVRGTGGTKEKNRKLKIKYKENEYIDMYYSIIQKDDGFTFKGQFIPDESHEEMMINSLLEIWQSNKLITTQQIDTLCSFRSTIKELVPVIIRLSNKTGTFLSFQCKVDE
ncbi:MAG: hypothetical protein JXJ04_02755 [Spirochaetales bacterium]|nr:hypothetical protein [Spirochaetales bacterium]